MNLKGQPLKLCSKKPLTGYLRDGFCRTINNDYGVHTVCARMTPEFLNYTASKGNDLSSVVKPGQNWCLCQNRWEQAFQDKMEPDVIIESTNKKTENEIKEHIFLSLSTKREQKKMRNKKKSLRRTQKSKKKNLSKTQKN